MACSDGWQRQMGEHERDASCHSMAAIEPGALDKPYFDNPIPRIVRKRMFRRELSVGVIVGVLVGVVAFGRALTWGVTLPLALTVSLTILVICTWSTTVGSLIPLTASRLGIDPTVLSAPLITTLVDATGLIMYFLIARAMLGLQG